VPATAHQLIGREEELATLLRLLDAREQLPGAAVLHGQAGIGKTSIWLAGIDAAAERGYRVLSCRPSEAETQLSYAGLDDLLGGVVDDVLPELPPIQRRALETALLLGDSDGGADERAVASAFLRALRLLTTETPVCLVIDDLQWLDAASLAVTRFAVPRLNDACVALFAVRGEPPTWLLRSLPGSSLATVEITGLSLGATRELLHMRLRASFPRPTLIRLWETSGGNPFFALELAAALQRHGGALAPDSPLPIPATLDELLRDRLDGLSPAAVEVAHLVAAVAEPTSDLLDAALRTRSDTALTENFDARILELDGGRLRFTHPLLGSAVVSRQTPSHRRALHARLAKIVQTDEERARHLALTTVEPDREIASILEEAARSAHARGAPGAAAELAEQAVRLTPLEDAAEARRRLLLAADRHYAAGDDGRAVALLEGARAEAAPGVERASILVQLAAVQGGPREAEALYHQALAESGGDDALDATIHLNLADLMRFGEGVERGLAHAELAVLAASRVDDVALRSRALAVQGRLHFNAGHGFSRAEMEEALALERALPEGPLTDGVMMVLCHQLWWSDDLDPARSLLQEFREVLNARNDAEGDAGALWHLGLLEWRAGNWDEADGYAAAWLELGTQLGRLTPPGDFPAAVVAAHRGRIDDARVRAQAAIARAEADGIHVVRSGYGWVLGFIELSLANPVPALEHLRRSHELHEMLFMREPGLRLELGDLLEALIAVGELDEADEIITTWEERARRLDRAWALAILARCRGLLLAARGDLQAAFASFELALVEHARSTDPFHHARTLLALGRTQRRAKKRAAARATLEEALARFETLGAPLWAEQTRAELARIGGRAPSRGDLTEAERRIAGLVAEGQTNREVAAALFLTVHSVETALTRIYRKLGVHSRSELTHRLSANS
jgi:DNA-binding CsgD family transcriptional regulator